MFEFLEHGGREGAHEKKRRSSESHSRGYGAVRPPKIAFFSPNETCPTREGGRQGRKIEGAVTPRWRDYAKRMLMIVDPLSERYDWGGRSSSLA